MKHSSEKISCGDFKALRKIVSLIGLEGKWIETKDVCQYRATGGAVLNYWESTGTITFQGPEFAAAELKAMVLRRAIVIK
jgi:hypothetical protein